MTKRAVLYARVSGDDRHREDRNLIGQLDMCREYALQRGYEVVEELAEDDRGASGAAFELPQLTRVRELARAKVFDVLVTRELDRLSRSLAKQLFVEEELRRHGAAIEYVLGEYADTPEGNLMKNLRASIAEFERLKISERMVRGRELKVKSGSVLVYGHPPFGYNVAHEDGKWKLELNETEARTVRMIFEWYTVGDGDGTPLGLAAIQKKLNRIGVPTYHDLRNGGAGKVRGWGEWGRAQINRILQNESYAGTWHFMKHVRRNGRYLARPENEHLPVEVPAIIGREVWEAAQQRRAQNRDSARRNLKYDYLLRRRTVCGLCGVKMIGRPAKGRSKIYHHYCCPAKHNISGNYARRCSAPNYRVDHVDPLVWQWVKSLLIDPQAVAHGLEALQEEQEREKTPVRERLTDIDQQLSENRKQLGRLLDLYLSGDFSKAMLDERKGRIETTIAQLEKERSGLNVRLESDTLSKEQIRDIQAFAASVAEGLENADDDFDFRRFVIETLDVWTTLTVEDGEKVVYVRCVLGEKGLSIESPTTRHQHWPRHPRSSLRLPAAGATR